MTSPHFTVLKPAEFITDVRLEAEQARQRVWAQAMDVEPGEVADTFFHILLESRKRNFDTRFHIDYFSLMVTNGIFNYLPAISGKSRRNRRKKMAAKLKLVEKIENAGIKLLFTNPPTVGDRIFPVRGRNHMKIVVVDDVAWIGGVNFTDPSFLAFDCMVKITDPHLVGEVAYVFEQIDNKEQLRDMSIECTDTTRLLVDGGTINRSLILRHTIELVNHAKDSLILISPLIPDAELLSVLKHAIKKGVKVEIISADSKRMPGIFTLLDEFNGFMMRLRGGRIPIQFKNHLVHAKILIADNREAIVGSHNFSSRGVRMGTEEIALQSTDPVLVNNLISFYRELSDLK
jgi:cardiolipin synthase A/B